MPWWLPDAAALLILLSNAMLLQLRYRTYRYAVTEREVFVRRGRLIQRSITVATPHVLHAEVTHGPVLRAFGLVKVTVNLVVGEQEIGPVTRQEAERIRQLIRDSATGER